MKHKKLITVGTALALGVLLVGCGNDQNKDQGNNDTKTEQKQDKKHKKDKEDQLDAIKYVETPQKLQKVFNKEFPGYKLSEASIDVKRNDVVYKLEGIKESSHLEASMTVKANQTSEIVKSNSENQDAESRKEDKVIPMKDVKKTPKDAIAIAKKEAHLKSNPNEWQLETDADGKPIYKVTFNSEQKEVTIDAKTGQKLLVENED